MNNSNIKRQASVSNIRTLNKEEIDVRTQVVARQEEYRSLTQHLFKKGDCLIESGPIHGEKMMEISKEMGRSSMSEAVINARKTFGLGGIKKQVSCVDVRLNTIVEDK
ncbi:Hypothetical_protein [Hexamita inflata]|uniref:Hypothetical_protein n=1 Tax=Hexamita inflata TaxID=28002 RepID=A0AA86RE26_9EUKA|nr:Hypothetical protein HINF_LOCUS34328 [Hexamita inflata]CAI9971327.1 Hypothetical protein HINF_LOCUS58972 [Hexamita inflata]